LESGGGVDVVDVIVTIFVLVVVFVLAVVLVGAVLLVFLVLFLLGFHYVFIVLVGDVDVMVKKVIVAGRLHILVRVVVDLGGFR
jgi:hypothetical protein